MAARFLAKLKRYATLVCSRLSRIVPPTHPLPVLLCICFALNFCKHVAKTNPKSSVADKQVASWVDLSTDTDGRTRLSCPADEKDVDDAVYCAFRDESTGLVWTSRAPDTDGFREGREFLPWIDAKISCEKLGKWAGIDGWRLPTEDELKKAFLNSLGDVRPNGFLAITEARRAFGSVPKYSFVWSLTEDGNDPTQVRSLFRGASNVTIGTVAKEVARGWYCVHATGFQISESGTDSALGYPPFKVKAESAQPLLPKVPPPAAPLEAASNLLIGDHVSPTVNIAARQWAIAPLTDLEKLPLIPLGNTRNPADSDLVPQPSAPVRRNQPKSGSDSGARSVKLLGSDQQPPISEAKLAPFNASVRQIFADGNAAEALNEKGHLVLGSVSGIKFSTGNGILVGANLGRAKKLIKSYVEAAKSHIPGGLKGMELYVIGYSNPPRDIGNIKAKNANKALSLQRAHIVANLVREISPSADLELVVDGRGDANPIPRSDQSVGLCGRFDCELSRRVEVYWGVRGSHKNPEEQPQHEL